MEHQSIGCRRRCKDVGDCMHWKHGVVTWTRMQWIHANNGESIHVCVYYNLKNNDNVVCNSMCTWWWVCAWILAWKQFMEHQSIGCRRRWRDIGDCMHWKHRVNTRTSMQAIVKVYTHMGTTIVNKNNDNAVCNCMCTRWGVCASILAWNNWWNISRSVVVEMHIMLVIVRTENMEWIHEHACSEYMSKHALKTWEQLMEHQSIGCRIRCWDIGTYKDWKHGVNTWTCMQWIHASNREIIHAHVYYNL